MTGPGPTDPTSGPGAGLALRQEALVRALVAGGPVPTGLDPDRVAVTARALARKRARVVSQVWPSMRTVEDFQQRFADWACGRRPGPPGAEGEAFARSLGRSMPLPVAVELAAARRRRWVRVDGRVVVRLFGTVRTFRTSRAALPL